MARQQKHTFLSKKKEVNWINSTRLIGMPLVVVGGGGKKVNSLSIEPVLRDGLLLAELSLCRAACFHPGKAVESWAGAEGIHRV